MKRKSDFTLKHIYVQASVLLNEIHVAYDLCCYHHGLMTRTLLSLETFPMWTCFGVNSLFY